MKSTQLSLRLVSISPRRPMKYINYVHTNSYVISLFFFTRVVLYKGLYVKVLA